MNQRDPARRDGGAGQRAYHYQAGQNGVLAGLLLQAWRQRLAERNRSGIRRLLEARARGVRAAQLGAARAGRGYRFDINKKGSVGATVACGQVQK